MELTTHQIKRLAFVRYLISLGKNQIKLREPLSSVSLLFFHDATELLLELVLQHIGAAENKGGLMDYWKLVKDKQGTELPHRSGMNAFNEARRGLKHKGNHPSHSQMEDFQMVVIPFCETVAEKFFEIKLNEISLIEFIKLTEVRDGLKKASDSLESNDLETAISSTALAFDDLLKSDKSPNIFGSSSDPLFIPNELKSIPRIYHPGDRGENREIRDYLASVANSIKNLRDAIYIIAMGLDFNGYTRFLSCTPEVVTTIDGKQHVYKRDRLRENEVSREDTEFCLAFAIDAAFAFQDGLQRKNR